MLRFAAIAATAAVCAVGAAKGFTWLDESRAAQPAAEVRAQALVTAAPAPAGAAQIVKSPDGHFWAQADVGGHAVRFLVDTGATAVALTPADARRIGIDLASLSYDYGVTTANGQAKAARVTLPSVAVSGARVTEVEAYVLDGGLETSLLGMTYLGRLSKFEATQTSLILRP